MYKSHWLPAACLLWLFLSSLNDMLSISTHRAGPAWPFYRECFERRYKPEGLSSLKSINVVKVTVTVLTISLYHYEPGPWLHLRDPFIHCIGHCMLNAKMYQINTFWIEVMNDQEPHIKSAIFIYLYKSNSFWRLLVITEKVWQSACTAYEWALAQSEQCFVGLL